MRNGTDYPVQIQNLTRTFGSKGHSVTALSDVTLEVPCGQILGLLGENGAGKTTLLKVVSTLLLPTAGSVHVCGWDVAKEPKQVRRELSVVFGGDRGLYTRLSGRDNLRFFAMLGGVRGTKAKAQIDEAIEQVGLAASADRAVETYSRGMRQRLHIAIGTLAHPRVLLLDEPTIGLDPTEAQRLRVAISDLARGGVTIILTSHHLLDIEVLADRVCFLSKGLMIHDAPLAQFVQQAGKVGTVVVQGQGDSPRLTAASSTAGSVEAALDGKSWTWRIPIESWSGSVFSTLAIACEGLDILDIAVEPVSLEQIYADLMTSERT